MIFDDWNRHNYLHQGDRFEVLGHSISAQIELQKREKKLALLYMKIIYFSVAFRNAFYLLCTLINKNHGLFTKGRSMVMFTIKTSEPVIQS